MDRLERFIYDLKYIIEIYDDIVKTYKDNLNSSSDVSICDIYNKDDLHKFIFVSRTCHNACVKKNSKKVDYIDTRDLVNYYCQFDYYKLNNNKIDEGLKFYIINKDDFKSTYLIRMTNFNILKMIDKELDKYYFNDYIILN